MNQQIALFFDIDGTLFDSKTKSILPSTKYMLEELRKRQNYDLYLSSGRSYVTLGTLKPYEKYFKGMNLTNGQEIYMHNDIYYGEGIDKEIIKVFLQRASEQNISLGLILKDEIVINFFNEESYHNFTNYIQARVRNLNHQPFDTSKEVLQIWIFASNDMSALGVMQYLEEQKVRVPEDISVVGYDDIMFASLLKVPLTTIHQPIYEMGVEAVQQLMRQINQEEYEKGAVIFEPELIIRESTAKYTGE